MHWQDEAIVLSTRRHGETSAVVHVLTCRNGRHAGLVRGGAGRRLKGVLQPGNELGVEWRGRLPDQLGTFAVELKSARAAFLLEDPLALAGLAAAAAMAELVLPEREAHGPVYHGFIALLDAMAAGQDWPAVYVRWELGLLAELGFGLDLAACAATGATSDLSHVSPRTGRAVSAAAAAPYAGRLMRLPAFLAAGRGVSTDPDPVRDFLDGLALTGFFLERHVLAPDGRRMPLARHRLVERMSRSATKSGVKAAS
ncbi:MAG: DNA repair protein RecO [Alphaproteobacteria bacterium]|nr:DNA repair protein RecO [Alphaproteobacteria bacterium]